MFGRSCLGKDPSQLLLPAGFCHGAGISRLLDTGAPVVAALYLGDADHTPFAVLPVAAYNLDDTVGSNLHALSATGFHLSQFGRAFDLLLAAGFAAAFPDDSQLREMVNSVRSTSGLWVGNFVMPLRLLPLSTSQHPQSSAHVAAMDALLKKQGTPLVLRLEAVPSASPLQHASQALPAGSMGLEQYAAHINRQPSDIRVVPVLAAVMLQLSRPKQSSGRGKCSSRKEEEEEKFWVQVDLRQQLTRCWSMFK